MLYVKWHRFGLRFARRRFLSAGIATPEDIALAATFLASDDARWITRQVMVAAGGKRM